MWKIGAVKVVGVETDCRRRIESAYMEAERYTSPVIQIVADWDTITTRWSPLAQRPPPPKPLRRGTTLYQAVMSAGG